MKKQAYIIMASAIAFSIFFVVFNYNQAFAEKKYVDPETGQIYKDVLYVDQDGWSVNNVVTVDYYGKKYYYAKMLAEEGLSSIWYDRIDAGLYKVFRHCDEIGIDNFRVFTIDPGDLKLYWSNKSKLYAYSTNRDGKTIQHESVDIIFSRNLQQTMDRTAAMDEYYYITISYRNNWDWASSGIIAVVQFAEDPGDIDWCKVVNVTTPGGLAKK